MTRIIAAAAVLLAACSGTSVPTTTVAPTSATTSPPPGEPLEGTVTVLDGDSIRMSDGSEIRLLGINAPEEGECWHQSAYEALRGFIRGELRVDGDELDQFGRRLAYVYAEGSNANLWLLARGAAIATTTDHELQAEFIAAENDAFADGIGMWTPGACGSTTEAGVFIEFVESNPDGPDEDDLNGEFVVLGNQAAEIDLTGWTVRDESSANRYALPDGFTLAEGAGVTIHTGCGEDTATDLYWCADQPVWNNDGDTALLLDPVGAPVSRYRYFED